MNSESIKKIADYGEEYVEKYLNDVFDADLMLEDWWEGLKFFLSRSFAQGRKDTISNTVKENAMNVLEEYIENHGKDPNVILKESNFSYIEKSLKKVIGKGKVGRGRDIEMVISILTFVSKLKERNIVKYSKSEIEKRNLKQHYDKLQEIYSIGPKISSFYLRDITSIYSLEKEVLKEDLIFLQPVDTWVKKVALEVGIINEGDKKDLLIREKIVKACLDLNVSAIKFNQGAWFLGYHSFYIVLENLNKLRY